MGTISTFKVVFSLECRRLLHKKTIGLILFFLSLSLYFVQTGIDNYKSIIENKDAFQAIERMKVKQYVNYNQYGTYGFRILFIPSPLSIYFFNSSTIMELTSIVDSGERLNIYNSFKGRTLFTEKSGGFKDFSGIMLLLGSFLVLYFGYESMIRKDYYRFMAGFTDYRIFFLATVLSRLSIIVLCFLVTGALSLLLIEFNGIRISGRHFIHFAIYLGGLELMLMFFFFIGTIAGTLKSRSAGIVTVFVSWFLLVFLVPGIVSTIISGKAGDISSDYQLELEKLKRLMDFEKRASEKTPVTTTDNIDEVREMIESYWNNEFPKIQDFEKRLEQEMQKNIGHFKTLSLFFPSTFYLAANDEFSSKGYENFILFFNYIQDLKKKFVRFYLDNRYYLTSLESSQSSSPTRVKSFIKNNENIFYAGSRIPKFWLEGTLLTLLYITGLLSFSYFRFKKSLQL
jgi:hypothetical protein